MLPFFGDSEFRDRIDSNPSAIPDYIQVRARFDRDAALLAGSVRRRKRGKAVFATRVARRLVLVATAAPTGSVAVWMDAVNEAAEGDGDYAGFELDAESRLYVRVLVGNILEWLVAERSLS